MKEVNIVQGRNGFTFKDIRREIYLNSACGDKTLRGFISANVNHGRVRERRAAVGFGVRVSITALNDGELSLFTQPDYGDATFLWAHKIRSCIVNRYMWK